MFPGTQSSYWEVVVATHMQSLRERAWIISIPPCLCNSYTTGLRKKHWRAKKYLGRNYLNHLGKLHQLFYDWWVTHRAGVYCPSGSPLDFKEGIFGKGCLRSGSSCKAAMSGAGACDLLYYALIHWRACEIMNGGGDLKAPVYLECKIESPVFLIHKEWLLMDVFY